MYIDAPPIGESRRSDCPKCGGRNSFTVTNDAGMVMYNCYKASCSFSGGFQGKMSGQDVLDLIRSVKQKPEYNNTDTDEPFELPAYVKNRPYEVQKFKDHWGISGADILYDVREDRAVFPVYKDRHILVDAVGRSLGKPVSIIASTSGPIRSPKWKRYSKSKHPYITGEGSSAVIVEDCVSATVVSETFPKFTGVALMGTTLPTEVLPMLQMYDSVLVALDPDAYNKSIFMAYDIRSWNSNVKVLNLKDDIKYRNEVDMEMLNGA